MLDEMSRQHDVDVMMALATMPVVITVAKVAGSVG